MLRSYGTQKRKQKWKHARGFHDLKVQYIKQTLGREYLTHEKLWKAKTEKEREACKRFDDLEG